jgi:multidrug efflux system outer membrane protein
MRGKTLRVALAAALFLQACAVGPNYRRPATTTPEAFRGEEVATPESLADLPWWEVFDDPVLQDLIATALRNNYDLQTAVARVEQARGILVSTRSAVFPQGGYSADAGRARTFFPLGGNHTLNSFGATLNLLGEIDLWGRIRRATQAARAQLLATNDARRGVILTLVAEVAQAYLTLLELDAQLEIARGAVQTFTATLALFQKQFEGGVGNKLAVSRGEAALAQAAAVIPEVERGIVTLENAISVLLGWPPTPIPRGRPLSEQRFPPQPPAGLPAQILERRPDVRQAEQILIAANAEIGVAVADFFPRIGLTTLYGGQSTELDMVLKSPGTIWQIAAGVAGPLFQGGRLIGNYKSAQAGWEAAKAQYEQTVLTALREVSDQLVAAAKLQEVRAERARAVTALEESSELATIRFNGGLATYFEVLEAQQQLFPAEKELARTVREQQVAVVQLYRALGGGWALSEQPVRLDAFPGWP